MLKFFQALFENNTSAAVCPESLVETPIERAIDRTDPSIRAVSGYESKLKPVVLRAIEHVSAMVDKMPPLLVLTHANYESDNNLRTFFISSNDMLKILDNDRNLADFRKNHDESLDCGYGLLLMDKQEKTIFGAELSGDIVIHDVPEVTVSFESHRFIDLCDNENDTHHKLKIRAYNHLLSLALQRITVVKAEHEQLGRYRKVLRAKLDFVRRYGWQLDKNDEDLKDVSKNEESLRQIEAQLSELGGDDRMFDVHLDILVDVLANPENHFWAEQETLIVDHMGIKRPEAGDDTKEILITMIHDSEGLSKVITPFKLPLKGTER
jgi:hypothetical protein